MNDIEVDGSFVQRFSQVLGESIPFDANPNLGHHYGNSTLLTPTSVDGQPQIVVPAGAPGGPLGLHGYWSTLVVKQTKGYNASECSIYWNEYRCDIGHPFGEFLTTLPECCKFLTVKLCRHGKIPGVLDQFDHFDPPTGRQNQREDDIPIRGEHHTRMKPLLGAVD